MTNIFRFVVFFLNGVRRFVMILGMFHQSPNGLQSSRRSLRSSKYTFFSERMPLEVCFPWVEGRLLDVRPLLGCNRFVKHLVVKLCKIDVTGPLSSSFSNALRAETLKISCQLEERDAIASVSKGTWQTTYKARVSMLQKGQPDGYFRDFC